MSPRFLLTCSAVSFYFSYTAPRYQGLFAVMCGMLLATAFITFGLVR